MGAKAASIQIVAFCSVIVSQHVCRIGHNKTLLKFEGTVTKRERRVHNLQVLYETCLTCKFSLDPVVQTADHQPSKSRKCPLCQRRGPFEVCLSTLVSNHFALVRTNFVLVQLILAAQCNIYQTKLVITPHA